MEPSALVHAERHDNIEAIYIELSYWFARRSLARGLGNSMTASRLASDPFYIQNKSPRRQRLRNVRIARARLRLAPRDARCMRSAEAHANFPRTPPAATRCFRELILAVAVIVDRLSGARVEKQGPVFTVLMLVGEVEHVGNRSR